jgi:hypothetical protein
LLKTINARVKEPLEKVQLERLFNKHYPDFKAKFDMIIEETKDKQPIKKAVKTEDVLDELLRAVRNIENLTTLTFNQNNPLFENSRKPSTLLNYLRPSTSRFGKTPSLLENPNFDGFQDPPFGVANLAMGNPYFDLTSAPDFKPAPKKAAKKAAKKR